MAPMAWRRLAGVVATMVVTSMLVAVGSPAHSAPRGPNAVSITGQGLPTPLTVRAQADPPLFAALLDQVSWLQHAERGNSSPVANLGPRYNVTVLVNNTPTQNYVLYPLASGGPRAFRPAKQPSRTVTAAWFFGRLTMAETLRAAGVPVPGASQAVSGGVGGGQRLLPDKAGPAGDGFDQVLDDLRGLLLLNATVIVLITAGLAGIALLVRRRTR